MADSSRRWSRDELLIAFELYCKTPFGKLHRHNPDVVMLATTLGRTPSAVAMKLVNFASLDEAQQARGIKGLSNASNADREIVEEFRSNWEELAYEASVVRVRLTSEGLIPRPDETPEWNADSPTERIAEVKIRVAQAFFRTAVIATYDGTCAICEIHHAKLLNASHIVPWGVNVSRRADPCNGLCLCAIHDRAFDRGLIGINSAFRLVLCESLSDQILGNMREPVFGQFEGKQIRLPQRFRPDLETLRFHFQRIFIGGGDFNAE
ncbi:HNH endonuclease [Planctomicrobium piriforme]|nr:HNH endonuclease [Planctomicrobium piriforme]